MFNDLHNQLQANNRQIETLLKLVDNLRYDNSQLTRRIDERISSGYQPFENRTQRNSDIRNTVPTGFRQPRPTRPTVSSGPTGPTGTTNYARRNTRQPITETLSRENPRNANIANSEEDLVFYFYIPRRDETPAPEPLTQETITQETTTCLFNEIENPNNLTCPISLELFQQDQSVMIINECRHIFNTNHLMRWFETRSTCPMCRRNIQTTETPPLSRLSNMATQLFSNVITNGVNDILNDLRI